MRARVGECRTHRRGIRIALGRIRSARAFDDRTETTQLRRRQHRRVLASGERADRGVGHGRDGARHRLDEHDGKRVEVGAAIERRARRLLWRRVSSGADDGPSRFGPTRLGKCAGETEIGNSKDAVLVEEEVRRLDVAVHEPAHVRILERRRDLTAEVHGLRGSQVFAGVEQTSEAPTPQQLEHHERHVVIAPVVDRHHVGMVQ